MDLQPERYCTGCENRKRLLEKTNGDYNVNDPDYGSYLPVAEYQITGLSEGTVTATGTPIDGKK